MTLSCPLTCENRTACKLFANCYPAFDMVILKGRSVFIKHSHVTLTVWISSYRAYRPFVHQSKVTLTKVVLPIRIVNLNVPKRSKSIEWTALPRIDFF